MSGTSGLPLTGLRIADFSWVLAGPHCTKWLAAMGAEVVKVESHFRPDRFRNVPPFICGAESMDSSVAFNMLNYSKKDCTINLSTPEGQRLAQKLVAQSDVVIENFSAGVAERLGLGYAALSRDNPKLVMVSASGVGRTGEDAGMRAFGKSIHAFSGQTFLTRWPHTPPRGVGGTWTDPVTGVTAALAILAGVEHAERTGGGVHFDLSMTEATIALLAEPFLDFLASGVEPEPSGNRLQGVPIHDTFATADGGWIAVAAHNSEEVRALSFIINEREGAPSDNLREVTSTDVAAFALTVPRDMLVQQLNAADVCAAPVLGFEELPQSPQFVERELAVTLTNEGIGPYTALRLPWRQYPAVDYQYVPAPKLGEHNAYVFETLLELSPQEVIDLTASEVLM